MAPVLWQKAGALARMGDLPKARETYERALNIVEGSPAADALSAAPNFTLMAKALLALEDQAAALSISHRASQIYERHYGADSVQAAGAQAFEAHILKVLSYLPRSQALFEHVIRAYERRYESDSALLVFPLYDLADVLLKRGDPAAAATYGRALRIVEKTNPPVSHAVAQAHWMSGFILWRMERLADARAAYERSLAASAAGSPDAVAALTGIANITLAEKNIDGARAAYDRAVEVARQVNDQEVASVLLSKSATYSGPKDYAEGSGLFEQIIHLYEKDGGAVTEVAGALAAAADFDVKYRRYAEARSKYERAIKMYEDSEGRDTPNAIELLNKVGDTLVKERKYEEAVVPLAHVLEASEKIYGPNSPALLKSLRSLFLAYLYLNRFDDTRALLQRSLKIVDDNDLGKELLATDTLRSLALS